MESPSIHDLAAKEIISARCSIDGSSVSELMTAGLLSQHIAGVIANKELPHTDRGDGTSLLVIDGHVTIVDGESKIEATTGSYHVVVASTYTVKAVVDSVVVVTTIGSAAQPSVEVSQEALRAQLPGQQAVGDDAPLSVSAAGIGVPGEVLGDSAAPAQAHGESGAAGSDVTATEQ